MAGDPATLLGQARGETCERPGDCASCLPGKVAYLPSTSGNPCPPVHSDGDCPKPDPDPTGHWSLSCAGSGVRAGKSQFNSYSQPWNSPNPGDGWCDIEGGSGLAAAPMALSQGTFFVVAQYTGSDDPPPKSVAVQVTVWTKAQLTVYLPTKMSVEASNGFGDGPGQSGSGGAITVQSNGTHVVTVPIGADGSGRLGIPVSVKADGAGSNISNVALATAYFKIDGVVTP